MNHIARFSLIGLIALVLALVVLAFIHYQWRLQGLVGDTVAVEFDKDAWLGCLPRSTFDTRLDKVEFDGLVITDTSGELSHANTSVSSRAARMACPGFGLVLLDEKTRQYFVPFHSLAALHKGKNWAWSNPFPA